MFRPDRGITQIYDGSPTPHDYWNPPELRKLDILVGDIELAVPQCERTCKQFMLDCLDVAEASLPDLAREALSLAKKAHATNVGWSEVMAYRERCWGAVDELVGVPDNNPAKAGLRAVLYVLTPGGTEELVGLLSFFLQEISWVEPRYSEYEALLRKHFGQYITENP